MKVLTVLGTRPEIIRLSVVIEKLDSLCEHTLAHTEQNFDERLNDIFFDELGVRAPDIFMGVRGVTTGERVAGIIAQSERIIREVMPDKLLILGDTDSGLSAIIAKRYSVPVYHMEAGNRCYDDRVPEEINRRIIDHSSDVLMPYTERSRMNLLREGIPGHRIYVTGNPILEVIERHESRIASSNALGELGLTQGGYILVTMHRAENVDIEDRFKSLIIGLARLRVELGAPVIISTHPHTRVKMQEFGLGADDANVRFLEPFGFFDFVHLERSAMLIVSDSGTVQEECSIFGVPNVTIRDVTERPETIECGSNMLCGAEPAALLRAAKTVLSLRGKWQPPREYLVRNVSDTVIKILMQYHHAPR
jgi:UDP-N-acetylglucosamine 2-epimerase (non-hydrolysing)